MSTSAAPPDPKKRLQPQKPRHRSCAAADTANKSGLLLNRTWRRSLQVFEGSLLLFVPQFKPRLALQSLISPQKRRKSERTIPDCHSLHVINGGGRKWGNKKLYPFVRAILLSPYLRIPKVGRTGKRKRERERGLIKSGNFSPPPPLFLQYTWLQRRGVPLKERGLDMGGRGK